MLIAACPWFVGVREAVEMLPASGTTGGAYAACASGSSQGKACEAESPGEGAAGEVQAEEPAQRRPDSKDCCPGEATGVCLKVAVFEISD